MLCFVKIRPNLSLVWFWHHPPASHSERCRKGILLIPFLLPILNAAEKELTEFLAPKRHSSRPQNTLWTESSSDMPEESLLNVENSYINNNKSQFMLIWAFTSCFTENNFGKSSFPATLEIVICERKLAISHVMDKKRQITGHKNTLYHPHYLYGFLYLFINHKPVTFLPLNYNKKNLVLLYLHFISFFLGI